MDVVLFVFIFNRQRVVEIKGEMGKKRNVSWQCRIKTGFELFPYKKTLHLQPLALANLIPWRVYTPNNTLKAQCSDPKGARTLFRSKLKTEEGYSADIYPWRYMSTLCLTRDICLFKHTCSQSYCKIPEGRRVVVDGEEQVEETPRFGDPGPLLDFMTSNSDCRCAWPPWKRHISFVIWWGNKYEYSAPSKISTVCLPTTLPMQGNLGFLRKCFK